MNIRFLHFVTLLLVSAQVFAQQYIDTSKTLFGVEYSFQDREIVNETGRTTMTTPYKAQKLNEMLKYYVKLIGLPETAIEYKTTWKPGYFINVPNDGKYVINTEPVTIEFNRTPKKLHEIRQAAEPIYKAAEMANLQPYVNPAAERSGMGHIHVGGASLSESPFYVHENLLRNIIAFFHKHPSLLYGFAEAYDVGKGSNIETLHEADKQLAIEKVIAEYDLWSGQKGSLAPNGLLKFIEFLKNSTTPVKWTSGNGFNGWFAHYRFINLEHVESLSAHTDPSLKGKQTIEFRMFRPPPTSAHAEALAKMLVSVMDYLAKPNHLEQFKRIAPEDAKLYMSGTKVQSDWEDVKKTVGITSSLLDDMVYEYVSTTYKKIIKNEPKIGVEIFEAYSEKEFKGQRFEIRLDAKIWNYPPKWEIGAKEIDFSKVTVAKKTYWIAVIDTTAAGLDLEKFRKYPMSQIKYISIKSCKQLIRNAG